MSILSTIFGISPQTAADAPRRALLLGTAQSIRHLRYQLRASDFPLNVIGAVLLSPQHRAGAIGLPVLGIADDLELLVKLHRIDLLLLCLPAAMTAAHRRIAARCNQLNVTCRTIPLLDDLLAGRSHQPASFDLDKLLDRPPHTLDQRAIVDLLADKCVLITGAGGSIGSELARIIARYNPATLVLMDRGENYLFEIHRSLREKFPNLNLKPILHDVTHEQRTLDLCRRLQPDIIFHAAAHKHVPMMEDHPRQAVENNFFGTKAVADAAHAVHAEKFVMISTDKAVNPTSIMGATKRLAELYIQHLNSQSDTDFTMVRFGNVLGSAGSVISIWSAQLAEGGPLTVTDPRMTRYFMTIPEAAALVIQSATLPGAAGQIMLLDMGSPIAVDDLARRFIQLHMLEPDRDIRIIYTGIRPGEKLFEQLAYDSEYMLPTAHRAVRLWQTTPPSPPYMQRIIDEFARLRHSDDRRAILDALHRAIPEMAPNPTSDEQPLPSPDSLPTPDFDEHRRIASKIA